MIFKNFEIHNAAELVEQEDGSVSWRRVPLSVQNALESSRPEQIAGASTGVELRFVIKGESATVRMSTLLNNPQSFSTFHVYRGGIQGGWTDHEVHRYVTGEAQDFVIERSNHPERLRVMAERSGQAWDPEVVRVIFDRGRYKIYDVLGDVVPPTAAQCPKKTLLAYGSSITHGSNAIDQSHAWVSVLAHNLQMDARNLGMAGSCLMEDAVAEYIAAEGEAGHWDVATLELGINALKWEHDKFLARAEHLIREVAGRNPDKPIFVISPFYHCGDDFKEADNAKHWRVYLEQIVARLAYDNVTYINGMEVLDHMRYMSADEVHPNIYGVQHIADILTERIGRVLQERCVH